MGLLFIISLIIRFGLIVWTVYLIKSARGWQTGALIVITTIIAASVFQDLFPRNLWTISLAFESQEVPKVTTSVFFVVMVAFLAYSLKKEQQTNQALKASEENFRRAVDESPLGIRIRKDDSADGELIYANQAILKIYGYESFEEFKKVPRAKRYTPESDDDYLKRMEKRRRGEYVSPEFEISIIRKDGEIRHLECFRKEALWNGKPAFQILYHDITKIKNMQEDLIMRDRMASLGLLVSGVAHEINNPLASIMGFSDLLLDEELPENAINEVKAINIQANRAALVVKNLLTFTRKQSKTKHPIDINENLQAVLHLRILEHSANNIKVVTRFSPNLPPILGNSSQLQQVFFNIIINAEFFMLEAHNNGTMTITTEEKNGFVRISIADDGPGITEEHLKRLFNPFFTTKDVGKGTGLGLSICQGIINEHGGKIRAESVVGKGATFSIELPAYNKFLPSENKNDYPETSLISR